MRYRLKYDEPLTIINPNAEERSLVGNCERFEENMVFDLVFRDRIKGFVILRNNNKTVFVDDKRFRILFDVVWSGNQEGLMNSKWRIKDEPQDVDD